MKKVALLVFLFANLIAVMAQTPSTSVDNNARKHKGFYLSMSLGPNFPSITDEVAGDYNYKYTGTGALLDFKIGGTLKENLILHATITSTSMSGPKITSGGSSLNLDNDLGLGEAMIGAGITYYVMPVNILFSGSVGIGNFTLVDGKNDTSISTDRGVSFQLKAGKEWWVSKRWGLGFAFTYSRTSLTNEPGGSISEVMGSNNFGIVFNASLN